MKYLIIPIAIFMLGLTSVPEKISIDVKKAQQYLPPANQIPDLQQLIRINEGWKRQNKALDDLILQVKQNEKK